MKRLILIFGLWLSFFCVPVSAQKKEIATAMDQVKKGQSLSQAQASMEKLLKDSVNRGNKKVWNILYEAVKKQYEQGNEKLYLKQSYDTAQLFNLTRQLFVVAQGMDSLEMIPDGKGKVHLEYRKAHSEYLDVIKPNLYSGGLWFVRKQKFHDAYQLLDQYLQCASLPLFKKYGYRQSDKLMPTVAYWAVYCGYKLKDAKATLHHSYEALKDTAHYNYMLQFLAETYKLEKDTTRYLNSLKEGFEHAPDFPFFFPRLIEHYVAENQLDSAMVIANKALAIHPDNSTYLFAKSSLLLNQGKNQESIAISEKLIQQKDTIPDAFLNMGLAYFNMAVELDKNTQLSRKKHQEINNYYRKAMPYLQTYRNLEPKETSKWALPLYTIYLNLNMGKEFDEIDKLLKQTHK